MSARPAAGVVLLLFLAGVPSAPADAAECLFEDIPGQGPSCAVEGGWIVRFASGGTALTHGADAFVSDAAVAGAPRDPVCVDASSDAHAHVVYARAGDRPDRYDAMAPAVRDLVREVNGRLNQEGGERGAIVDYKVRCAAGVVEVANAVLPTPAASATFSTIVSDLRSLGHTSPLAKYWVWYDGAVDCGGCAGQATVHADDRLVADNAANAGNDFAVTYGVLSSTVMMHENAHNLGAVQLSAPHTSGSWHCNDGSDVMCYADGGPSSAPFTACADREHFDCGHDDYFDPAPAPGSYLATHWNLGSRLNRFVQFGVNAAPVVTAAACAPRPVVVSATATCTFTAVDDSTGVSYVLDWGDGTATSRVPATGVVAPGTPRSAAHAWTAAGAYDVAIVATDNALPPLSSAPRSVRVDVACAFRAAAFGGVATFPAPADVGATVLPARAATGLRAAETARAADVALPGGGRARLVVDTAEGSSDLSGARAKADAVLVDIVLGGGVLELRGVRAHAEAVSGAASAFGHVREILLNGVRVEEGKGGVTELPGVGRLVTNETSVSAGEARARAARLVASPGAPVADVVLGEASAGALCDSAAGAPQADDDAGSGGDAGDGHSEATPVAVPTHAVGRSVGGDVVDAYAVDAAPGEKLTATLVPAARAVVAVNQPARAPSAGAALPEFDLVLREPGTGAVRESSAFPLSAPERVELNVDVAGAWVVEVRRASLAGGNYTLDIGVAPIPLLPGDGAALGDAGDSCATASPLPPGGTAGVLREDDPADWYFLDLEAGVDLVATLKPGEDADGVDIDLVVHDPACAPRTSSTLGKGDVPKGTPDAVVLRTDLAGAWKIEVRRVSGVGDYALAVTAADRTP